MSKRKRKIPATIKITFSVLVVVASIYAFWMLLELADLIFLKFGIENIFIKGTIVIIITLLIATLLPYKFKDTLKQIFPGKL